MKAVRVREFGPPGVLAAEELPEPRPGEGQATLLGEMGCDFAQGYHFEEPLPPEEIPALLSSATLT